jgi:hypothetical protein
MATLTPVLQLYKPTVGADDDLWGGFWNQNADKLDQALDPAAGIFLPLAGGTVTTPTAFPSQIIFTPTPPLEANKPNGAQFGSYLTTQMNGGGFWDPIFSNTLVNTNVGGAHDTGIWNLYGALTYTGTGGKGGHVAVAGQAVRAVKNAGGTDNNPQLWGALFNYIDQTNPADSAGENYGSAVEIGIGTAGTDSAESRRMLGMYLNQMPNTDVPPVVHLGIHLAANQGSFNYGLRFDTPFNIACIDMRTAVKNGGHTVWLRDGGDIAWDTQSTATTYWDAAAFSGAGGLHFSSNVEIDGQIYTPSSLNVGGAANIAGAVGLASTFQVSGTSLLQGAVTAQAGLTSNQQITINTGASVDARVVYTSARTYWAGSWSDGSFYLIDATGAPTVRLTVSPAGDLAVANGLSALGAVTFIAGLTVGGTSQLQGAVTALAGLTSSTQLQIGVGGPTWTAGTAAPTVSMPAGSMYSRINGAVGARFYICSGTGTWAPVPGV